MSIEVRRVGFWGRDDVAAAGSLAGVLHLEAAPHSFTALCNDKRFGWCITPASILEDRDMRIRELRICKRCSKRAAALRDAAQRRMP